MTAKRSRPPVAPLRNAWILVEALRIAPGGDDEQRVPDSHERVAGDLNRGVATNVFDAITTLQVIVGLVEPTAAQGMLGDLTRQGTIDVLDAITELQIIVGLTEITECGLPAN